MVKVELTEQELDLVQSIRNYNKTKSYNYSHGLETYTRELFDNMMDE